VVAIPRSTFVSVVISASSALHRKASKQDVCSLPGQRRRAKAAGPRADVRAGWCAASSRVGDDAITELVRVIGSSGRIVIGLADPDAMAKMPFTSHGFNLRPVSAVIDILRGTGLSVEHRRISQGDDAAHLLIGTPAPPHI
jgi:hypothetical protein